MNKEYTEEDIDEVVETVIEGVKYIDTIVGVFLPDGQYIIGPRLKCAHLFARFSMIPSMEQCSEEVQKMIGDEQ